MDSRDVANRNLLFGLLALQNGLIDQLALVGAFHAWTLDKKRSIAEILTSQETIDSDERSLLEGLVEKHIKRHGGDPGKSLAGLALGHSTVEKLGALGDADLTVSLATTAPRNPDDTAPYTTATHQIGTLKAEGQRFRVIRPHAKGGLGAVYVALDGELNREVALKEILDRHADDPVSRSRFVIEAEVTGGLEHPGIVPVYGLGHYVDGRPYYAMRFIRGDSLKEAIAAFHGDESSTQDPGQRSLAFRKLLRRFVDVCNAIDYAHGRGILHRDLKPGNIIVGKHGETLIVDWGLAKAMGRSNEGVSQEERTLVPSSASGSSETLPGQAIGTPAFMSPEQALGDLDNLGPRSDVYSLGATLYCLLTGHAPFEGPDIWAVLRAVQKGEFSPPRQLDASIEKPLEAICLKAMALKAEDRYETARSLADDIERWIADEPVSAFKEPRSVKLARWARRNRTKVAAFGLSLTTAVILLATLSVLVSAANRRTNQALARVEQEQARTLEALTRADANFRRARQAVEDYFTAVSEDVLLYETGMQPLRAKLLESALKYHEGFFKERGGEPGIEAELALSHRRFANIADLNGRTEEASTHLNEALLRFQALLGKSPDHFDYRSQVAETLYDLAIHRNNLARYADGTEFLRESIGLEEKLRLERPGDEAVQVRLAFALARLGENLARERGKREESEQSLRRAREILSRLVTEHPDKSSYRVKLADLQSSLYGMFAGDDQRSAEALDASRQAMLVYQELIKIAPNSPSFQQQVGLIHLNRSLIYARQKRFVEGIEELKQSRAILGEVVRTNPNVRVFRKNLAQACMLLGTKLSETGSTEPALEALREASELFDQLSASDSDEIGLQALNAQIAHALGNSLGLLERYEEAIVAYRKEETLSRELIRRQPDNVFLQGGLMSNRFNLAMNLFDAGRYPEAVKIFEESLTLSQAIFGGEGWSHLGAEGIDGELKLAYSLREVGRIEEAEKHLASVRDSVDDAISRFHLARYHARGASLLAKTGSDAKSIDHFKSRAILELSRAVGMGYSSRISIQKFGQEFELSERPDFQLVLLDSQFPPNAISKDE